MNRKPEVISIVLLLFWSSLRSLALASGSLDGLDSQNQQETSPGQRTSVTVLVHNYAHLPAQILIESQDRAGLIFRKAGVEIEWADCPLVDEDPSLYPRCPAVVDQAQLFLRIVPWTATKIQVGGQAFVAARIANIFWNRVEGQTQMLKAPASRVMAHSMAHELGHLLLGANSHSPAGIMAARWDAQVLTRICQEGLYFNRQQSEVIRSEIRNRKGQSKVVENALLASQR